MDLFRLVLPPERTCETFRMLQARITTGDRTLLDSWLVGFADRDGKFVQEFQASFHSSFWELYLHAALRELGFRVTYEYARPDFVVEAPTQLCIEAVSAQPAGERSLEPAGREAVLAQMRDLNSLNRRAIIRLANSFSYKSQKYLREYSPLAHVKDKPFVLAIAAFDSPAFFALSVRPIEALLYGHYVDEEAFIAGRHATLEGTFLETLAKENGAPIELGVFNDDRYAHISAVICNPCATWGKVRAMSPLAQGEHVAISTIRYNPESVIPHREASAKEDYSEDILDGMFVFHNPHARIPVSHTVFEHPSVAQAYWDSEASEMVHIRRDGHLLFRTLVTAGSTERGIR